MSKAKKITAISFSVLFAIIGIFLLCWFFGDSYNQFYSIANKEFEIPGLKDGYTPQGLCYEENSNIFLSCGYMKDGSASRIYVIDGDTNETKYFTLKNGEENYSGHAGGIDTDGVNVWIVGDGQVFRFMFAEVKMVENKGNITIVDSFESKNGADFVTIENGNLWVGEFHRDGKYNTPENHEIQTENSVNKAISFCYQIDNNKAYGIDSTTPIKALSTRSLVQGMVITNDKIVLSTSYSLPNSHIYIYNNILSSTTQTFDYEGNNIPLYILQDTDLQKEITAPCMSEEITLANDRIFVLFESACKKYNLVTREPLKNVYSFKI